jgi:hypothetical protein
VLDVACDLLRLGFDQCFFVGIAEEHDRTVGRPAITELATVIGRVNVAEVVVEDLGEAELNSGSTVSDGRLSGLSV